MLKFKPLQRPEKLSAHWRVHVRNRHGDKPTNIKCRPVGVLLSLMSSRATIFHPKLLTTTPDWHVSVDHFEPMVLPAHSAITMQHSARYHYMVRLNRSCVSDICSTLGKRGKFEFSHELKLTKYVTLSADCENRGWP